MAQKLTAAEIDDCLKSLTNWTYDPQENCIKRTLKFNDFADALGFMVTMGVHAQAKDHHPEWTNVYNTVIVKWSTHTCHGVSLLDVEMARKCDCVYLKYAPLP